RRPPPYPTTLARAIRTVGRTRQVAGGPAASAQPQAPWHFLYFLPDPHGHMSLRPTCCSVATRRCSTCGISSATSSATAGPPAAAAATATALGSAVSPPEE